MLDSTGSALKYIVVELAKQGNWSLAETIGLEITLISDRHDGRMDISKEKAEADGWYLILEKFKRTTEK